MQIRFKKVLDKPETLSHLGKFLNHSPMTKYHSKVTTNCPEDNKSIKLKAISLPELIISTRREKKSTPDHMK